MLRRLVIVCLTTLPLIFVAGEGSAVAKLTSKNAVRYDLMFNQTLTLTGTHCGGTATYSQVLPAGSASIELVSPKVGERDESGSLVVSNASVTGTTVSFTVTADGPLYCDSSQSGYGPGEAVPWDGQFDVRAEYERLIPTLLRVYFESYAYGAEWKSRPKTIQDTRKGTPRANRQRVTGIKWRSFGGKRAVGFGRLRQDFCRRGDFCPENGKRVKVVASRPDYCRDTNKFEYFKLDVTLRGRTVAGSIINYCN